MPQLDVSTFPTQIFWLIIFFTIFMFFIWNIILPKINHSLQNRDAYISSIENKTKKKESLTSVIKTDNDKKLTTSTLETERRLKEIKVKLAKEFSKTSARLNSEYKNKIRIGFHEIQTNAKSIEEDLLKENLEEFIELASQRIIKNVK